MKKISLTKIYLLFILLLGLGLRIYKLGENSLWTDEALFIIFRKGNLFEGLKFMGEIFLKEGWGIANYGYTLFSTIWSYFVKSEFMLRFSSVIFGVICIFFIYKVGKLLFDKKTGLIAAFLLAISPFHIYYSQEFRMYSLMSLLTLTSVYFLKRFQQNGSSLSLCGYIISHCLNFYTNIATVLILFAQATYFLLYRKKYNNLFRKWLLGQSIIALLILPGSILTIMELMRLGTMKNILSLTVSTDPGTGFLQLLVPVYTFKNFFVGYNASPILWWPAALLFSGLFVCSLIKAKKRETLYLCLCCLFIPVFIMYLGQKFSYADRYLIPSSLFLYLIVCAGIVYLTKPFAISALILILIFSLSALKNYYKDYLPGHAKYHIATPEKHEYREAAKYIFDNFQQGDIIFHTQHNSGIPFLYYFNYYSEKDEALKKKVDVETDDWRAELTRLHEQISPILGFAENGELSVFKSWDSADRILSKANVATTGHKRIWLVFSNWYFESASRPGSTERKILKRLEKHYIKESIVKYFKGVTVYLFTNPQFES